MEFNETDAGKSGHIYRLQKIDEIKQILMTESHRRSELGRKYNKNTTKELLLLTQ